MKKFKSIIKADLKKIKEKNVAVLFSGGIDSLFIMFCLHELKKKVHCYTFHLEDRESSDLKYSKIACDVFGVKHTTIPLPVDIDILIDDVKHIISKYGCKKKTEVECTWPVWKATQSIKEKCIVTGIASDGYFGLSKKAMINFRHTPELMNKFRASYFGNPASCQQLILPQVCNDFKKIMHHPFFSESKHILKLLKGTTWEELNKPFQKQVLIDCFPKLYKQIKLRRHLNFQTGDSGITDHFKKLLQTELNTGNWKSTVGIYNNLKKAKYYPTLF